jgi:hypothetical protein
MIGTEKIPVDVPFSKVECITWSMERLVKDRRMSRFMESWREVLIHSPRAVSYMGLFWLAYKYPSLTAEECLAHPGFRQNMRADTGLPSVDELHEAVRYTVKKSMDVQGFLTSPNESFEWLIAGRDYLELELRDAKRRKKDLEKWRLALGEASTHAALMAVCAHYGIAPFPWKPNVALN